MIVYQLRCSNGHEFEAWFRDSTTYDTQALAGDVNCPHCGDEHICKAIMSPNIASSRSRSENADDMSGDSTIDLDAASPRGTIVPPMPPMPPMPSTATAPVSDARAEARAREVAEEILEAVSNVRAQIEENCENVGDNFAEEAKRIHDGEAEERGIYGSATDEEAEELTEEGVEFYRLPTPRRDS